MQQVDSSKIGSIFQQLDASIERYGLLKSKCIIFPAISNIYACWETTSN